jgi:gas vesicle protein
MSDTYSTTPPVGDYSAGGGAPTDGGSTTDTAKEQASHVADGAKEAGAKVAGTAKEEGAKVVTEAKTQVKDLFEQTKGELADQAGTQQQRVASGLHSISDELGEMGSNAPGGVASDLVQQAASRVGSVASWLEQRDPGSLLDDVRTFARQRPGTFIAIAAGAGILAGRLARSAKSVAADSASSTASSPAPSTYTAPATTGTAYTESVVPVATGTAGTVGLGGTTGYADTTGLADDGVTGSYPDGQYPVDDTVLGEPRLGENRP